ncbi:C-GCAxxG-C-C family protein [uncultured Muribaculum sp.]|uniref:C-GCAxxG-C-C family protein n=1 Tax=uncultured Muribaculum sp. TaxID=1918613 RepID=UPI002594BEC8|nr:C-GCAxxG-C-C family protein [uncultured Muribaculum sp.]
MNKTDLSLQQRLLKAKEYKGNGYNCAQCMFMAFSDIHNLDDNTALALSCGLGGGVGGQRQICGAVSTMASILGMTTFKTPADKARLYKEIRECSLKFEEKNGSTICAELKGGEARKPCMSYIEDAIEILHNRINEDR